MDKNEKEKNLFYEWACRYDSDELKKNIFSPSMQGTDSYFVKREKGDNYLREYEFQTLPELRAELEIMWAGESYMDAVLKPVLVGSFKNRIATREENTDGVFDDIQKKEGLSPYIYNF